MGGLDPHMLSELKDELKSCSPVMLAICLWRIYYLSIQLWVCINLYFISNLVLIKLDQLKLLKCL
jgi:hypothetical protein